jgi:hypothetical protein
MALAAAALTVFTLFASPTHAFQGLPLRSHARRRSTGISSASADLSPVIICPAQFGTEDDYAGLKVLAYLLLSVFAALIFSSLILSRRLLKLRVTRK